MTVNNIIHQKRFWWDVIYDYYTASGKKLPKMADEIKDLKTKTSHELERHIISQYGPDAFQIKNDLTRPFYVDEVRDFSRHKHVVIGNHTMDHAILTNLSQKEVMDQIMNAQDELQKMIGYTPRSLAYPNGNYSAQVLETMKESGIQLGFTTTGKKNSLPLPDQHQISRVDITMETDIRQQCDRIRSDISLLNQIRWYLHP